MITMVNKAMRQLSKFYVLIVFIVWQSGSCAMDNGTKEKIKGMLKELKTNKEQLRAVTYASDEYKTLSKQWVALQQEAVDVVNPFSTQEIEELAKEIASEH